MTTSVPPNDPKPVVAEIPRSQLYARIGFGALLVFGMIGSFTGHGAASGLVFLVLAVVWVLTRITTEAIDAWTHLNVQPPTPPSVGPSTLAPSIRPPPVALTITAPSAI